ncbi:MAG: tRNA-specific adenosine deaminase [Planctomycetaceae bacterium]|nr:tRNA-specific adenosine deaminase [Planctomycetaceae bacterium]
MIDPEKLMRLAIEKAREGLDAGQSPFGCAIARGDELLAVEHNTVVASIDITAHAEVNALRVACKNADAIILADCVVATTCEPCPMCMAALHWARVSRVYYGASIADAEEAGFNELQVPAADVLKIGRSKVILEANLLSDECRELFQLWKQRPDKVVY